MIGGTLNQDLDFITGAEKRDDANRIYVSDLTLEDKHALKHEVINFLKLTDEDIVTKFKYRYPDEFSPEDGKSLLQEVLQAICKAEKIDS